MQDPVRRFWVIRLLIGGIVLLAIPLVLALPAFLAEAPIRAGEISPRTVIAPTLIRVDDPEATERARRDAAEAVQPVYEFDPDAAREITAQVRDWFTLVRAVREPAEPDGEEPEVAASPTADEQRDALADRLSMLDDEGIRLLVGMSDSRLDRVANEAIGTAQELARQRIREEELEQILERELRTELAVRDLSSDVAERVVEPMLRAALRPTVVLDEGATLRARRDASATVSEVVRSFPAGSVIVAAGDEVSPVQVAALERAGLAGADPRWELLRAFGVTAVALGIVAIYLRAYRRSMWRSNRDLLLLAVIFITYAIALGVVSAVGRPDLWLLAVPAGALAMLTTILLGPPVGVLAAIPITLLTAFIAPDHPAVITFAAAATLLSVPFASRLSARGDLRRATLFAAGGYVGLAAVLTSVFGATEDLPFAILAGAIHGAVTAVVVLGGLPFLESAFGIVTATSLIDLADRNHPLLRELEQKALGSYNHSIVVATLVERACRAIDADGLLGSVCALYHDIGKVRRPYFFVENQFGIRNPHDDLEPEVSAKVIHRHVDDGIEMAETYHLPAEVVEGIATHHGTTLVSYFYLEAVRRAAPDEQVDPERFRYAGRKPRTKETAVLMLADCCEAASRAAAQNNRNITSGDLIGLVDELLSERIDDGQLDESTLTFHDLAVVRESFIETLVGVYHPRIAYPNGHDAAKPPAVEGDGQSGAPSGTTPRISRSRAPAGVRRS